MTARSPFAFDWVFERAQAAPDAPALGTPDGWMDYASLARSIRAQAALFAAQGVRPGGFVVLALPNGPAAVAGALAVQALGACPVEVHRELSRETLAAILDQTGAAHAVVHLRDAAKWGELARARGIFSLFVVAPDPLPARAPALLAHCSWKWLPESRDDRADSSWNQPVRDRGGTAQLVYTSGSTGAARGVLQTWANVEANTQAICRYLALGPSDRAMSVLPLFYCYGRSILHTHLHAGGSVFFDHRFLYPRLVMEAIGEQRCTGFYGVPLTFELVRRHVDLSGLPLGTLRYVAQAGGAMSPETIRWARSAFAPAPLFVMYGQTEATSRLSYLPPGLALAKEGSVGRGLDNVELGVVDDEGRALPAGEIGHVVARGPSVTPGYFRAPEETAAILRGGWLWTGDLGRRDADGFVYLCGRAKDVLKLGGHRVSAAELEQVLSLHPAVGETAVVGVPDPASGEAALAFVVPAAGAKEDALELRRFCGQRMPAFKVPRHIRFVDRLPRTASGKVAKAQLRERIAREVLEGRPGSRPGADGD